MSEILVVLLLLFSPNLPSCSHHDSSCSSTHLLAHQIRIGGSKGEGTQHTAVGGVLHFFLISCIELNMQANMCTRTYRCVNSHIAAGSFTQNADDSCQVRGTTGLSRSVGTLQHRIWDTEVPYSLFASHTLAHARSLKKPCVPISVFFSPLCRITSGSMTVICPSAFTKAGASGNGLSWERRARACVCESLWACLLTSCVSSDV